MAEKEESDDHTVAEIEKKIMKAFDVFDHECNKAVDVREIGSIVWSLGCFPAEAELHELLAKVLFLGRRRPTKRIHSSGKISSSDDKSAAQQKALDKNKCGYITKEDLVKYLTEEGEPFTQEEMENILSTSLDPDTSTVHYRDHASKMIVDES